MKIARDTVVPIDFEGLQIVDYPSGSGGSSSFAEITVEPGIIHRRAHSKQSDKYYYVVSGRIEFVVENTSYSLTPGDVCIILKGQRFSYGNTSEEQARVILVRTPAFNLGHEVFEEQGPPRNTEKTAMTFGQQTKPPGYVATILDSLPRLLSSQSFCIMA